MSILNSYIKPVDLDNNDGLSMIDSHAAQQHHNAYSVFYDLISTTRPDSILEIGTALGGFTAFLAISCKELGLNTNIRTYDICEKPWYSGLTDRGVDVRIENIFSAENGTVPDDVISFINNPGLCLVLCDGGHKITEFNILSKYIKSGDIIMAHDYAPNKEYFHTYTKDHIWNWHEIEEKDILQAISENILKPYQYEEMLNIAWACYIKE